MAERYRIQPLARRSVRRKHYLLSRRRRRFLSVGVLLTVIVLSLTWASGGAGASAADFLRATLGASKTAQIESVYLDASDAWQQMLFRTGVKKVAAPWVVPTLTPHPQIVVRHQLKHTVPRRPALSNLRVLVSPSLAGEGVWTASVAPASPRSRIPLIAKAFVRPDPARPYAVATILRFDLHHTTLHLVAGITEPGGPLGHNGTGAIPLQDQHAGRLLAVFNGGFKYADGAYGMMAGGQIYAPPLQNAATVAVTRSGRVLIGAWGHQPGLRLSNRQLVSWRQNGTLLIDHGIVNPLAANNGAWGTTVLNAARTWRSAIGLTRNGSLLYVAGNSLSVSTLARTLTLAGARTAMEMDINPYWVRAFFYGRDPQGHLAMAILRPDMQGNASAYLSGYSRDFLYITRR